MTDDFEAIPVRLARRRSAVGRALGLPELSQMSWVRFPVWPHTFISPSADSRGAVVSYWRKYVHEVLVNRLGGLSLPRKSVVRITGCPDMTLDVYRERKTTTQQQALCLLLFSIALIMSAFLHYIVFASN